MPLTVGDRAIRPLTADEVMDMVSAGIIGEDDRVELLHGVLTEMSPQHPPHTGAALRLTRWLAPLIVGGLHDVRVQFPFRVPDDTSLPEPDLAVVTRDEGQMADHPRAALLVIEVAVSSRRVDLTIKPPLYASAGVPEYWVVDVPGRCVHVFTDPVDSAYGTRTIHPEPEQLAPRPVEVEPLDLAALFAGL